MKQKSIKQVIHLVHHHNFSFAIGSKQIFNGISVNSVILKVNFVIKLELLTQNVIRKQKSELLAATCGGRAL